VFACGWFCQIKRFEALFNKKQWAIGLFAAIGLAVSHLPLTAQPAPLGADHNTISIPYTIERLPISVESGLEAYDKSPLGQKTPLILVHGIAAQNDYLFNWHNFLSFVDKHPAFKQKYKIYLYHYDSSRSVAAISGSFRQTLKEFVARLDGKQIKILAYSEGGLLTRNALQDPYLDAHTLEVLTIATPFHGSPLANPEWMEQQVKTEPIFNVLRMTQKLAYKITGKLYPTFKEDFHWDNFDGAIPMTQYIKHNGPMEPQDYTLAHKANFITYGSYFGVEDGAFLTQKLGLPKPPPKEKLMIGNLFRKNMLFSVVRNNIGKLPLASASERQPKQIAQEPPRKADTVGPSATRLSAGIPLAMAPAMAMPLLMENKDGSVEFSAHPPMIRASVSAPPEPQSIHTLVPKEELKPTPHIPAVSMMIYNDGISPISSTLWLGRYAPNLIGTSQPVEKLWDTLKTLRGNRNTRLFAGIDHRNWMDGDTRTGNNVVQDLLNPDQKPRTVFEWIIDDLMS
jgi:pimeloyl-ACP methyl ester carboxylesterase